MIAALSKRSACPVQLTDGDEENLKITTPLDLELAALILRRRANARGSATATTFTGSYPAGH